MEQFLTEEVDKMEQYSLQRNIPVEGTYDVVIAGGGPAGCAAAIAAGRLGAKVLLLEATGCLGGMATSGLVTAFDPMGDGEKMLVGGLMQEIVETMYQRGHISSHVTPDYWRRDFHRWTPFNPEGLKVLLDELTAEAQVEVRFFTRVIDADVTDKKVNGIVIHNVEGYRFIQGQTFIDATGDAVLADLCGAPHREAGRDTEHIMPPTLCFLVAGIDFSRYDKAVVQDKLEQAIEDGFFTVPDRHHPGTFAIGRTTSMLNVGHIFGMNAVQERSLSRGMAAGRSMVQEYVEFYRRYIPGFEEAELVTTGSLMGVRESRCIVGEYELTFEDYLGRRQFPDQIGVFNKAVDIHPYDGSDEEFARFRKEFLEEGRLKPGECFGLPYGILVPRGWHNLWAAGRCASADVQVHGSIRVQPAAAMMGQAAGTAAVQSIRRGEPANRLDTVRLTASLRRQGAYLP